MNQRWNPGAVLAWVLCASTALAEPDTFGLGTGRDGTLTITEPRKVINRYTQVVAPLAPGDTVVSVSSVEGFSAGDLVMVVQTTGIVPEPARGEPGPIPLGNDPVGRWELARLSAAGGQELKLVAPLLYSYAGGVTQVIRVPEYTDVKINAGASLVAAPWDGSQGGVLAFLASGTIQNEGELQASGAGFRGGVVPEQPTGFAGCSTLPAAVREGAGRGEGISSLDFGLWATGLENASNGGGGGLCPSAGGGGGGNGAAGGQGGDSMAYGDSARDIGGQGGAALVYSLFDHLTLGGGGGQGYGGGRHSQGGAGGGAIFVRGYRLAGSGSILADGFAGEDSTQGGAGGGGAGGSISLRIADSAECGLISARGGNGGSSFSGPLESAGPGGGGGGGRVLYQAARSGSCPISVEAGLAGEQGGASPGLGSGAQPDWSQLSAHRGTITRLGGGFEKLDVCDQLAAPVFTKPLDGQSVKASPTFEGTIGSAYQTGNGVKVTIYFGASQVSSGDATVNLATKTWSYTPATSLSLGLSYKISARGSCNNGNTTSTISAEITVTVDTLAPDTEWVTKPNDPHFESSATFSFKATGETRPVTFVCKLDMQAEGPCGGGAASTVVSYDVTSLTDGSHTFTVAAVDEAGNRDATPVSFPWTVELRPDTEITRQPSNPTNDMEAIFEFRSTKAESLFQCKLGTADWAECTSPKVYPNLTEDTYTFSVKAIANGREDLSPATATWVVDLCAPDTRLPGTPVSPSNDPRPTFTFNSTEEGSTFQCVLDGVVHDNCTSPWTVPVALGEGTHGFSVRATDVAGNPDPVPAMHDWVVDLTPPDTRLPGMPGNPSNNPRPTFTFDSTEAGSTFQCVLDGAVHNCTSPWTVPVALGEGTHGFSVRATDVAGNPDPVPAMHDWVVDLTPPDTRLPGMPGNPSNNPRPTFTFNSTEEGSSFECKLDTVVYANCISPWTVPEELLEGSHRFSVKATDAAGNPDPIPATHDWRVDMTPPDTELTSTPGNPSNNPRPSFSFRSTETGGTFECVVDGVVYNNCTSPWTVPVALGAGDHTFSVKATDAAGNPDPSPASHPWVVDLTPPDTELTGTPSDPSNEPTPTFTFRALEAGSTFECKLDTVVYANCTSPWSVPVPLRDGLHEFWVKAIDAAGNPDPSPASFSWTVDTTVPNTEITGAPRSSSNNRTPTFTFRSTAPGSTFDCELDEVLYEDCVSPWTVPIPLEEGPHHFSVEATDAAGNTDPEPSMHDWTVDLTPPDTELTDAPRSPSNNPRPSFTFSSTEEGSTFKCMLDGVTYLNCASPWTVPIPLGEGPHHFSVEATDAAGNTDPEPTTHDWTVDLTRPNTRIDQKPANSTNRTDATFTFSGAGTDGKYWCSLDSASETLCDSGRQEYQNLPPGGHTFCVAAEDAAGNRDLSPDCYTWEVDLTPPVTVIEDPKPRNPTNVKTVIFRFSGAGPGGKYRCKLVPLEDKFVACDSGASREYPLTSDGAYTFSVYSIDAADNSDIQNPATHTWVLDATPPETRIVEASKPPDPSKAETVTFIFNETDTGLKYWCSLDQRVFESCDSGRKTYDIQDLPEGRHTFSVYAVDAAGNVDASPATYSWTVDRTGPVAKVTNPTINSLTKVWRTNNPSPTFAGTTSEVPSQVRVSIENLPQETTEAVADGSWGLTTLKVLDEGRPYTVRAQATDSAENSGNLSDAVTFIVDRTSPETEIVARPREIHNNISVQFSFAAPGEPAELVTTFECRLVAHRVDKEFVGKCNKDQSYSLLTLFGITNDNIKAVNGKYTIFATAIDEAGNPDPTPEPYGFDVVVEPPESPEIKSPAEGEVVYDLTPTISGETVSGGTVDLFLGETKVGLARADAQGLFSFKVPEPLEETTHVLKATVTDVAGNPSAFSSPISFTVTAPKPQARAIGGGLGCAASTAEPWLALLGMFIGAALHSRRRRP